MQQFEEEISEVVLGIWAMLFAELPIQRSFESIDSGRKERTLFGCVQITGEWQGAVSVNCSDSLAKTIAAAMFDTNIKQLTSEQIQDAIGEIANMTGGNIKGLFPSECHLSLPTVAEGNDYIFRIPGSFPISQILFDCQGELLMVSLLQKDV